MQEGFRWRKCNFLAWNLIRTLELNPLFLQNIPRTRCLSSCSTAQRPLPYGERKSPPTGFPAGAEILQILLAGVGALTPDSGQVICFESGTWGQAVRPMLQFGRYTTRQTCRISALPTRTRFYTNATPLAAVQSHQGSEIRIGPWSMSEQEISLAPGLSLAFLWFYDPKPT